MNNKSYNKTRIAPTPSGFLHIGNALSMILTTELAKKYGASIHLRIDDLDHQRARKEYIEDIFDTLHFLGIKWQEGPANYEEFSETHSQLKRLDIYDKSLEKLKKSKRVFACTCSRSDLQDGIYRGDCLHKNIPLETAGACWRLDTTPDLPLSIKTLNGYFKSERLPGEMQFFIVRKKDGLPSYQLSSAIDDLHFGIDLIVRGMDLWPSTLAQQYLMESTGNTRFREITFLHHPLLKDKEGKKLSKSKGAESIQYLRKAGKSPLEVIHMIAESLGSSSKSSKELAEFIIEQ